MLRGTWRRHRSSQLLGSEGRSPLPPIWRDAVRILSSDLELRLLGACMSWRRNGTNPAGSIDSFSDGPGGKVIQEVLKLLSVRKTNLLVDMCVRRSSVA